MTQWAPRHFNPGDAPAKKQGGILIVYGHPSVGKTQFAINTWDVADTLYFLNFDRDASHLIKKYEGTGGCYYEEFSALTRTQANTCLEKMTGMKNLAMSAGKGVFVLDNFLHADEIVTLAKVDPDDRRGGLAHGPRNLWWRDFLFGLERSGCWVILTAPAKEIWVSVNNPNTGNRTGQATGLFDPDGWKHVNYHITGEVWLFTNRPMGAEPTPVSGQPIMEDVFMPMVPKTLEFKGKIMLAKKRSSVEGVIVSNPTLAKILKVMKETD